MAISESLSFGAEPFSEPSFTLCLLGHRKETSVKLVAIQNISSSFFKELNIDLKKMSQNAGYFFVIDVLKVGTVFTAWPQAACKQLEDDNNVRIRNVTCENGFSHHF